MRRVPALGRDRRDALQILGAEPLEERDASQAEHALDDAECCVGVGHGTSCDRAIIGRGGAIALGERAPRQGADPRIGVSRQVRKGVVAVGRAGLAV